MLAYEYPLLGLFWTMLWIYILVAWLMVLFSVIADVFRNRDMGGFAKAIWLLIILVIPLFGVLIYLLAHGDGMTERKIAVAQAQDQAMQAYVQNAAGTPGHADQIAQLAALHQQGTIDDAEFKAGKAKILS